MAGWLMNEQEKISKEVVVALLRYYPKICLEQLRKTTTTSVRTATVPAGIENKHLLNTSLQH
jgi:phage baseplate assembly protein W